MFTEQYLRLYYFIYKLSLSSSVTMLKMVTLNYTNEPLLHALSKNKLCKFLALPVDLKNQCMSWLLVYRGSPPVVPVSRKIRL